MSFMIEVIIYYWSDYPGGMIPILQRTQHIQNITYQDYSLETFSYCMCERKKGCHAFTTSPHKGESPYSLMYPNTSDNANGFNLTPQILAFLGGGMLGAWHHKSPATQSKAQLMSLLDKHIGSRMFISNRTLGRGKYCAAIKRELRDKQWCDTSRKKGV